MRNKEKSPLTTLKANSPPAKPLTPKKPTAGVPVRTVLKFSPTSHRQNEFELVYKLKNSGKSHQQYSEESFESMILLKSKNKIKRFGNKSKRDQKKNSHKGMDLDSMIKRIQNKIQKHKEKENAKLQRVLEKSKSKGKKREIDGRRTGFEEVGEAKPQETVDSLRRPITKIPLEVKSPRHCQSPKSSKLKSPKPPRSPKPLNTTTSKRRKQTQRELQFDRSHDHQRDLNLQNKLSNNEYILFDNKIIAAADSSFDDEISTLMYKTQEIKRKELPKIQPKEEPEYEAEDLEVIRKYFDEKATTIQKLWRGYQARKLLKKRIQREKNQRLFVNLQNVIVAKEQKKEPTLQQPTPTLQPTSLPSPEPFLFSPTPPSVPQNSKETSKENSFALQLPPPSLPDKLGSVINEISRLSNPHEQQQLLSQLRTFVKQKQLPPRELPKQDVNQTLKVRQNAIDLRLSTQISVLKRLSNEGKLKEGQYDRRLIEAEKWAYQEKQEIDRIKLLLKDNVTRAAEIVKQAHQEIVLVERVKAGQEDQAVLNKVLDSLPCPQTDQYFFFPNNTESEERPKSTGCHFQFPKKDKSYRKQPSEQQPPCNDMYNTNLKQFLQEFRQRQKVKNDCDRRIATQMSYIKSPLPQNSINTSMQAMHTFLTNFFRFVVYYYKHEFLRNINMPYGYSPERRIKQLQGYEFDEQEPNEEMVDCGMIQGMDKVISMEILAEFQQHYYVDYSVTQQDRKPSQDKSIMLECIHNRAIFDAFNESLNLFRPYFSINGPPYLWNTSQKALTFYFIAQQNIQQVFQKTKYKVMKCTSDLCGLLVPEYESTKQQTKEEMIEMKGNCHKVLGECREQRLLKSQKYYIHETDYQWFLFEEEKTDTMLEIGNMLLAELVKEICIEMRQIM